MMLMANAVGKNIRWLVGLVVLVLSIGVIGLSSRAQADTFVQTYDAIGAVGPGWVVSLNAKNKTSVEATPANDPKRIYGVVINANQAPVTVQHSGQQVFVATSGDYPVLVSAQNGPIKAGDYVSMSSIDGIAAKATSYQNTVLGQALTAFDGKTKVVTTLFNSAIGSVTVTINPALNPLLKNDVAIPAPLRTVGESIAGKSVSAIRIYSSLAIFFVTTVVATFLLWVGVRSGIIAIGRNPLSRKSILQSLAQVIIVSILIFIAGLSGVYLLLKL